MKLQNPRHPGRCGSVRALARSPTCVHFADRLIEAIQRVGNPVLAGIDPWPEDLPPGFLGAGGQPLRGGGSLCFIFFLDEAGTGARSSLSVIDPVCRGTGTHNDAATPPHRV